MTSKTNDTSQQSAEYTQHHNLLERCILIPSRVQQKHPLLQHNKLLITAEQWLNKSSRISLFTIQLNLTANLISWRPGQPTSCPGSIMGNAYSSEEMLMEYLTRQEDKPTVLAQIQGTLLLPQIPPKIADCSLKSGIFSHVR
jgi:hypothetical protein